MPVVDADGNEQRRKKRVIPYVEDRRNILVLRLDRTGADEPVAAVAACTRSSAASRPGSSSRTPS